VQIPTATPLTVLPDKAQMFGVLLAMDTDKPDVAVALTAPVPPTVTVGVAPKVMLWLLRSRAKLT
jgi:hypothetical protein